MCGSEWKREKSRGIDPAVILLVEDDSADQKFVWVIKNVEKIDNIG